MIKANNDAIKAAAACLAAVDVLEQEPERIAQLWDNTRYFKQGLQSAGFNTGISETPITPVIVGDAALAPPEHRADPVALGEAVEP